VIQIIVGKVDSILILDITFRENVTIQHWLAPINFSRQRCRDAENFSKKN